ncbi:MAG: hypothetical protein KA230_09870, partial [Flavobacteriales bacterium]|nr:hypothetical protein [Flavobacteriales bacterium]
TPLTADVPTMITQPIVNPVAISVPRAEAPMPKVETPQPKVEPQISEPYLKVVEPVRAAAPAPAPEPAPAPAPKVEEPLTQSTFEFEITNEQRTVAPLPAPAPEKIVHQLTPDPVQNQQPSEPVRNDRMAPAEHQMRVEDRIAKMRELTLKLRSPNGLADLEREPAYKRKNLTLTDGPRSTESNVSRYTLSEGTDENGERRTEIKKNNPFLHDNVD